MMKISRNKKAQMIANEYAIVFTVVIATITVMIVYFKRAIQARVRGGQKLMYSTVKDRLEADGVPFTSKSQYEPYYVESSSLTNIARNAREYTPVGNLLIRKDKDITERNSTVFTAPPIEAQ